MKDKFDEYKEKLPDFVKTEEDFQNYKIRHTAEHVFSQATLNLYPEKVERALAHLSEDKFANDANWKIKVSEENFKKIEKEMRKIINRGLEMKKEVVSAEKARELFGHNKYKVEMIDALAEKGEEITVYHTGNEFVDLCMGPHVDNTKEIGAVKLMNVAGAYWKADENNEMLTRVYGVAFKDKETLDEYVWRQEEAKKRDHRKLGRELDLFHYSELVGGGLPLFTPRGTILRNELIGFVRELQEVRGYMAVDIPHITKKELYETSGHWDLYKDDLFHVKGFTDDHFCLKPMNCPHHTQIYASQPRSYRDLPIRYYEATKVYRDEQSGELHGLSRVRAITQDDAHVFCRVDQIEDEVLLMLEIIEEFYKVMDMETKIRLSIRDPQNKEKYLGTDEIWEKSESMLANAVKKVGREYYLGEGEAAFYGPKLDFMAIDSLGREWQLATAQLDMNMPERFELEYTDSDSEKKRPVMLHRAVNGSIERFLSIAIEHFAGKFPVWLAPEQVRIIPISDQNVDYAEKISKKLRDKKIRFEVDKNSERMQNKIRLAQEMQVPYMVIVGGREEEANQVSVRLRSGEEIKGMDLDAFVEKLAENISERRIELGLE